MINNRMDDESMVDSASPSDNNTTFSATLTSKSIIHFPSHSLIFIEYFEREICWTKLDSLIEA